MDSLSTPFIIFLVFSAVIGVFMLFYWIKVLTDCASNEASTGNEKLVWLLIIFFGGIVGALIYVFIRRPTRIAELGH